MATTILRQCAAATAVAAALSLATVTTGSAAPHWGPGAAIGAGIAGFALGAAAASAASPYYGYYGYAPGAYYDYAPGPVVVAPGPYYDVAPPFGPYDYGWRRPGQCRFSIRGC
jgi:hypothetical protein